MPSITRAFIDDLRMQVDSLEIAEIKQRISARMTGRTVAAPEVAAGTFVYRARRVDDSFHPSRSICLRDLSYPPAAMCRAGRLNRQGYPLFYASTSKSPLLFELGAEPGEEFVFSIWRMTASPMLSSLGYTSAVFSTLGATREAPSFLPARDNASTDDVDDLLSELFAERVPSEKYSHYKVTAAIAELHYELLEGGAQQFAGVLYPSVAMWANGDNVALRPWFVAANLKWTKALHIRVDSFDGKTYSITDLDSARDHDESGALKWAGHPGTQTGGPGPFQVVFTAGRDELGDYIYGKDNVVGHWLCTEVSTGRTFSV